MRIQNWVLIYWIGAICALCGYYIKDSGVIFVGLLIILLGAIKGMERR